MDMKLNNNTISKKTKIVRWDISKDIENYNHVERNIL